MDTQVENYFFVCLTELLNISSVSSDYDEMQRYILKNSSALGCEGIILNKGGVIIQLGGNENPIVVTAHCDTLGLMVKEINPDGTLRICNVGRLPEYAVENANVVIKNIDGRKYSGTVRRKWSCIHVTPLEKRNEAASYDDNLYVQLDQSIQSKSDVLELGIECGDLIDIETKLTITDNGYIKSYFLDDKLNVALLLAFIFKYKKFEARSVFSSLLNRKIYIYFSMHEEVMHGGAAGVPKDAEEILALDVSCVCPGQNSEEKKVTICCADSRFPYNREMIKKLEHLARKYDIDYCRDIFMPTYGTDADLALLAGYDVRHALIGAGVVGTHGYERTHIDGVRNTFKLLESYLADF